MKKLGWMGISIVFILGSWMIYAQTAAPSRSPQYAQLQSRLQRGWNTWDTDTIIGEVLLPEGLEIRLGIKYNTTESSNAFLPLALIGRQGATDEQVIPGSHAYDGSFNALKLAWRGYQVEVQAAHAEDDLVMLVEPVGKQTTANLPVSAAFSVGLLWNRPGAVSKSEGHIVASMPGKTVSVYLTGEDANDPNVPIQGPYFTTVLNRSVGISTGKPRSIEEIKTIIERQRQAYNETISAAGPNAPVLDAIQTTLAWDTIYEPQGRRVISPVSRIWNLNWGGYVLFDWDTFFAADLAAVGDRDLAYANAMEILNETTPQGFVPNYARSDGWKSSDRSEPPVGAITVLALYRQFHDKWFLEDTFDRLLRWNRWWAEHRDIDGYLAWGSDGPNEPRNLGDDSKGTMQGARYESGLDNGPAYDTGHYNPSNHLMEFADVGLMGLYVADCDALATIADLLGKTSEAKELTERATKYRGSLAKLWNPEAGIYLNKDLHTGEFAHRLAPTNFYPLLAKVPTADQADEMIRKHLMNPEEFWGERVIPSIARSDPAFNDQDYWRGRIWGPMNYLVYLGLLNYDTPTAVEARQQLAARSMDLFSHEWREKGHVHENYSAISDDSDTVHSSDRFYHWGALLGLIEYQETSRTKSANQSDH